MTKKLRHYIPSEIAAPRAAVDIALVGAGGTGSQIISGLARINYALLKLGHPGLILHAIDGDTISDANIGRQIFSSADVGRNKAETLISRINSFYGFRWYAYPRMMNQTDELCGRNQPLMVITAIDKGSGRLRIIKTLKKTNMPYNMDFGNTADSGQVVLGTLRKNGVKQSLKETVTILPTVIDLYPDIAKLDEKEQGPSCSVEDALSKQDLFVNQWIATCGLQILWNMFRRGHIDKHGAFANLKTMSVRPLPIDPELWSRMGWKVKKTKRKKS